MNMKAKQRLSVNNKLAMTQQIQLAIKLLQLNSIDLQKEIDEIIENHLPRLIVTRFFFSLLVIVPHIPSKKYPRLNRPGTIYFTLQTEKTILIDLYPYCPWQYYKRLDFFRWCSSPFEAADLGDIPLTTFELIPLLVWWNKGINVSPTQNTFLHKIKFCRPKHSFCYVKS